MSKNCLSKERACQRNAVQQQLDKSSAMEDQLQEMIRHIEGMNYELADEVKSVCVNLASTGLGLCHNGVSTHRPVLPALLGAAVNKD